MSSKADTYPEALQQLGIAQNTPVHISEFETAPCRSDMFNANWASYSGNTIFDLSTKITREFQNLYIAGKAKKKTSNYCREDLLYFGQYSDQV